MIDIKRKTNETDIKGQLNINGKRKIDIQTGIGFFDHLLTSLAFWAEWDLSLTCTGDLQVDTHHTVEDVALALGSAFCQAVGENKSIQRIANSFCPMDEALSRVAVDISNRPFCVFDAQISSERVGEFETAMTGHFFRSFAQEARITLHIHTLYGDNGHHLLESMFKGLGIALKEALMPNTNGIPSTKGVL